MMESAYTEPLSKHAYGERHLKLVLGYRGSGMMPVMQTLRFCLDGKGGGWGGVGEGG